VHVCMHNYIHAHKLYPRLDAAKKLEGRSGMVTEKDKKIRENIKGGETDSDSGSGIKTHRHTKRGKYRISELIKNEPIDTNKIDSDMSH